MTDLEKTADNTKTKRVKLLVHYYWGCPGGFWVDRTTVFSFTCLENDPGDYVRVFNLTMGLARDQLAKEFPLPSFLEKILGKGRFYSFSVIKEF